jgi:hypothetical protein
VNFSDDLRKHAGTRGDQRESTAIFSKFSIVQANPPSLSVNNVSILSIAIIVERLHARVARVRKSRRQARVLTRGYHKELAFRTAINSSNFDYILICATKLRRIHDCRVQNGQCDAARVASCTAGAVGPALAAEQQPEAPAVLPWRRAQPADAQPAAAAAVRSRAGRRG